MYLDKGERGGLQVARHAVRVREGVAVVLRREKKVALVISSIAREKSASPACELLTCSTKLQQ